MQKSDIQTVSDGWNKATAGFCDAAAERRCLRAEGRAPTLLRAGPQRGMMGSNNHIITSSVWTVSDVRGIKEACRVHTQAASPHLCQSPSHSFTHMCNGRNSRHVKRNHTFYYGIHANTRTRIQKAGCSSRREGRGSRALGVRVRGHRIHRGGPDLHQRARSELKPQRWPAGGAELTRWLTTAR